MALKNVELPPTLCSQLVVFVHFNPEEYSYTLHWYENLTSNVTLYCKQTTDVVRHLHNYQFTQEKTMPLKHM
jgi:hypothetical protein